MEDGSTYGTTTFSYGTTYTLKAYQFKNQTIALQDGQYSALEIKNGYIQMVRQHNGIKKENSLRL